MNKVHWPDKIISATEARQQLFKILDEVEKGELVLIHRAKHKDVVIVNQELYLQLLEKYVN